MIKLILFSQLLLKTLCMIMSMAQNTYMYYDSNLYRPREKFLICECGQKQCTSGLLDSMIFKITC